MRKLERPMTGLALLAVLTSSCEQFDPTAPFPGSLAIEAYAGDRQHSLPGSELAEDLRVRVTHSGTGDPVEGIQIEWNVAAGIGVELIAPTASTDFQGAASVRVRLGARLGPYILEAKFPGLRSEPARFTLFAVSAATIVAIHPAVVNAGDTVRVEGTGFAARADDQLVLFDGLPAAVARATRTSLIVVVPPCLPTRTAQVVVQLGSVLSNPAPLDIRGTTSDPLRLAPGQDEVLGADQASRCVSVSPGDNAAYLLVAYNTSTEDGTDFPFQLTGVVEGPSAAGSNPVGSAIDGTRPVSIRWEARLRSHEQELIRRLGPRRAQPVVPPLAARAVPPAIGQMRNFNVFSWEGPPRSVRAIVRAVSTHAVFYQDLESPEGGFSNEDLSALGRVFDDPVYGTDTSVFGTASDVDDNERIIVLLSPAVNKLTAPAESGFIAGFTSFCDLLTTQECLDSNVGEILYSIVPDSIGRFGKQHKREDVLARLPGVLAHELAHAIHFNQRMLVRQAATLETVWLSEALAHAAEDTVGRVLRARGDAMGERVLRANHNRAALYLADPARTALAYPQGHDSLEGRGAGWLFLTYLTGRFGPGLLTQLAQATDGGAANVTARLHESWESLVGDWFLALFADDAPGLAMVPIHPRFTYPNINLREELSRVSSDSSFPLRPLVAAGNFRLIGTLASTAASYVVLEPRAAVVALRLSGPRGKPLDLESRARLRLLRLR